MRDIDIETYIKTERDTERERAKERDIQGEMYIYRDREKDRET